MSEGAKAVRLVVSRPFQQLRKLRFLPGSGTSTTSRPVQSRPQKNVFDMSEVHYHYDDFGNRIENPKEYLKGFKNSISHSHSHIGDSSALPQNVLKELEYKEEMKFGQDVDSGNAFSHEFSKMPPFQSSFHNSQFNSFGGFESTTHHTDDWAPMHKAKPASSLHTSVTHTDNLFGNSNKFLNPRPITNYRSVKHYDSDRPSSSYSFHHFASPSVDYGVDTKEKSPSFGSLEGSSSMKVQNFDHFYDYFDKKFKDHHGSESQIQSIADHSPIAEDLQAPEAAPLVQKQVPTTTTTVKPTTTTRARPTGTRSAARVTTKTTKSSAGTDRPNYPEYFFAKPKPETQKPKFIPVRNIRDEEDLFKGTMAQFPMPPAKFVPQSPKFPTHTKEPVHIVLGQPVNDKASLKAKEKFRKQMDAKNNANAGMSLRKRYPTTRLPPKAVTTSLPSPIPTFHTVAPATVLFTESYAQNEVSLAVENERKYPKKYQVETTTPKVRARPVSAASATPSSSSQEKPRPASRGSVRARGSVRFGARV